MKVHWQVDKFDGYTRCGKANEGGDKVPHSSDFLEVTCKTCLAALLLIPHPSTGTRRIHGKRRQMKW